MAYFLTTDRLGFRVMAPADLDFLAEMLSDSETMRFYPNLLDRKGAVEWLEKGLSRQHRDGYSFWLVEDQGTGIPIGQVGLLNQEVEGKIEAEIGYMLHRQYWRQGFASEAASAVRDYAFHALGKKRVISLVRPINIPSQRVALSYGAKPEKLVVWRELEHLVFALNYSKVSEGKPRVK
ncbi:GNAT family N-acetyltransferase [Bythopirellula polymerisocia]|uniref:N-acetyltransferase domain-containing protein n=1 Tax=Bythopirellula polymerisocia TaxID=2528003 RepID=A0A5C6CA71_9BACT|nr:GNAT family N-acetyltransferase [Bythopirellula polymerisocia]TWU20837.1 hypothetical protein Pla144_47360 [Bythopirellula polymerisocia]